MVVISRRKRNPARFDDGVVGVLALVPLGGQSEVDHHDGVLLDNADQQNNANDRDNAEVVVSEKERQAARPRSPAGSWRYGDGWT